MMNVKMTLQRRFFVVEIVEILSYSWEGRWDNVFDLLKEFVIV